MYSNVLCMQVIFCVQSCCLFVSMSTKELISPGGVNCQACQSELSGGREKMWTLGLLSILVAAAAAGVASGAARGASGAAGAARAASGAILKDRDLNTRPIIGMQHKEQYRKFETNIPRKGIARPQSQFPHSRVSVSN
jgi:hypothetical protein